MTVLMPLLIVGLSILFFNIIALAFMTIFGQMFYDYYNLNKSAPSYYIILMDILIVLFIVFYIIIIFNLLTILFDFIVYAILKKEDKDLGLRMNYSSSNVYCIMNIIGIIVLFSIILLVVVSMDINKVLDDQLFEKEKYKYMQSCFIISMVAYLFSVLLSFFCVKKIKELQN